MLARCSADQFYVSALLVKKGINYSLGCGIIIMMDNHDSGGGMEHHVWFSRFEELVLAGYTVTAIKNQLVLEGFDLSEFGDATLISGMITIIQEE